LLLHSRIPSNWRTIPVLLVELLVIVIIVHEVVVVSFVEHRDVIVEDVSVLLTARAPGPRCTSTT
jgi:hypothetical protein